MVRFQTFFPFFCLSQEADVLTIYYEWYFIFILLYKSKYLGHTKSSEPGNFFPQAGV
jgi:hypothetical protein